MIIIPTRLKEIVQNYIKTQDRNREVGGFFFGTESRFQAFLPCPNYSKEPWNHFDRGGSGSDSFAKHYSDMIGLGLVAEMHTHPSGNVASEADLKYLSSHSYKFEVVVADMKDEFRWFVIDRNHQEVGVVETDDALEQVVFILAKEVGLTDLGRVLITPKNELLTTNKMGKMFLSLDEDALRLFNYEHWNKYRFHITRASKDLNMSLARIKNAKKKLESEKDGK